MKIVILAAGFGSRLWPISTPTQPKQFQKLLDDKTLLQYTYDTMRAITGNSDEVYVLTLNGFQQLVADQVPGLPSDNIIAVAERRNTLPHALFVINQLAADATEPLLFVSVDHAIHNVEAFITEMQAYVRNAHTTPPTELELLCTPVTDYISSEGYAITDPTGHITRYVEKPTRPVFDALSDDGAPVYKYTVMYKATAEAMLRSLSYLEHDLAQKATALLQATPDTVQQAFLAMPFVDTDSVLFQVAGNLRVVIVQSDFTDLGTYAAVYKVSGKDERGNVIIGNVIADDRCKDNFLANYLEQPLVVVNTQNSVIVQSNAGTLHTPIEDANAVGDIYKTRIIGT